MDIKQLKNIPRASATRLGLGLCIFGISFSSLPEDIKTWVAWSSIVLMISSLDFLFSKKGLTKNKSIWLFSGVVLAGALITVGIKISQTEISKPQNTQQRVLSLHEVFKNDFPNTLRPGFKYPATVKDDQTGEEITTNTEFQLYQDSAANSEFLGVYIPHSPASYDVAALLPNIYEDIRQNIKSRQTVTVRMGGDIQETNTNNLSFSGRVYLYHEDTFSLQQRAELEKLYQDRGLSLRFRGAEYHSYQIMQLARDRKN